MTSDLHAAQPDPLPGFAASVTGPVDGVVTATAVGDVDLRTAPRLGEELDKAQAAAGAVLVDMRQVGFIGSAGLSVLVDGARRASDTGGRIAIVVSGHTVRRAIEVTGLDAVLKVFDDVDAARSYLRA